MVSPRSFLTHRRFLHAKLAGIGLALAAGLYVLDTPLTRGVEGASGDTPYGYALGTISAALVLWLAWFGARKRSYASTWGTLSGWLSAHVYLGAALLLLVPLHAGFELGANLHSLAYGLLVATVFSGALGVALYATLPARITLNRPGQRLETLLQQLADLDGDVRHAARELPDYFAKLAASAIDETRIGGGLRTLLSGRDPACATTRAVAELRPRPETQRHWQQLPPAQRGALEQLVKLLTVKQKLLERVRRDLRYKAWLDVWLLAHVPLSLLTLLAVAVHVAVVLYYG